jgi:mannose-6-phosphate isomerase
MIKSPDFFTFTPVFKEKLWGGRKLEALGFKLPDGKIGECWGISAHPHGMSIIDQGKFKGFSLEVIYKKYPHWFNNEKKQRFPLLIKILDAHEDLSIQVHPNDSYALKHDNDYGKHEAWYVLDAKPNTRIQIGHNLTKKEELIDAINKSNWSTLLRYFPNLSRGDVIDIPPGTLHALCSGSLIFEIQQASDVTYRVFDYNRSDKNGEKRELHLSKAIDVINIPSLVKVTKIPKFNIYNKFINLVENNHFILKYIKVNSKSLVIQSNKYLCGYVIKGSLIIGGKIITQNKFFLIPSRIEQRVFRGEFEALISETK